MRVPNNFMRTRICKSIAFVSTTFVQTTHLRRAILSKRNRDCSGRLSLKLRHIARNVLNSCNSSIEEYAYFYLPECRLRNLSDPFQPRLIAAAIPTLFSNGSFRASSRQLYRRASSNPSATAFFTQHENFVTVGVGTVRMFPHQQIDIRPQIARIVRRLPQELRPTVETAGSLAYRPHSHRNRVSTARRLSM